MNKRTYLETVTIQVEDSAGLCSCGCLDKVFQATVEADHGERRGLAGGLQRPQVRILVYTT